MGVQPQHLRERVAGIVERCQYGSLMARDVEGMIARALAITEEIEALNAQTVELGRERRELVTLLVYEGFSGSELSRRLGITRGRVYSIISRPAPKFNGQRGPAAARDT